MKQLLLFILLSFILTSSCSSNGDRLELPNQRYFLAAAGERIFAPNTIEEKRYHAYFNTIDSIQIPLFKSIFHSDYTLFLGIPVGTSKEQLHSAWAGAFADTIAIEGSSCICTLQDEKLIARCLQESSPGNLLLLGFLFDSKDTSTFAHILSDKHLSKRIISDETK
jgi:hypothetical protein